MEVKNKGKIILAMDGGIDVAVAGTLLKVQGYDMVAVHIRVWEQDDEHKEYPKVSYNCAGIQTEEALIKLCKAMQISLHIVPVPDIFYAEMIDNYLNNKLSGRRDVSCRDCLNNVILKSLIAQLDSFGAEAVATGHYARITYNSADKRYSVWQSKNQSFDSSRFFFDLKQEELAKVKCPVSDLSENEVSILADKFDLKKLVRNRTSVKRKPCFLPIRNEGDFIEDSLPESILKMLKGDILDKDLNFIKPHNGIYNFNLGERPPIKVSKKAKFVKGFQSNSSNIIMGLKEDVFVNRIILNDVNLISIPKLRTKDEFQAVTMDGELTRCFLQAAQDKKIIVNFFNPKLGFWPGKLVALYDNNLLLGGGVIEAVLS